MKTMVRLSTLLVVTVFLVACATDRREQVDADQALFERHAGDPVNRVNYAHIRGWRPAGDNAVLIEFNGRRYYLLDVGPPCQRDLRFSHVLSLRTTVPRALTTFDQVGSELGWCRVERIRPFDFNAYQAERRGEESGFREAVILEEDPAPEPPPST